MKNKTIPRPIPTPKRRLVIWRTKASNTLALFMVAGCGGAKTGATTEVPINPTPNVSSTHQANASLPEGSAEGASATMHAAEAAVTTSPPTSSAAETEGQSPNTSAANTNDCPAGTSFVTGGSFQRAGTTKPKQLPDLCVDVLETTVTEYANCVTAGACTSRGLECSAQATWNRAGKEQQPIFCVEYDQATAYCAHRGKRLPTVDEWEWVARSGAEARTYSWGNEAPDEQLCWTGKLRQTESCVVGTHPQDQSANGVFDLTGNVLEFVTTERDAHSPLRIAKGGAWNGGESALFTNTRLGGFRKEYRCGFLGVRCVKDAFPSLTTEAKP